MRIDPADLDGIPDDAALDIAADVRSLVGEHYPPAEARLWRGIADEVERAAHQRIGARARASSKPPA